MNSQIFSSLGMGDIDPAIFFIAIIIITIVLFIAVIALSIKTSKLNKRCNALLRGKDGESLESLILKRFDTIDRLFEEDARKTAEIDSINKKLKGAFQKCGVQKYDAFNEMGGKLSFAIALLDQKNNGFLINAMHSREGCYTYIKEIVDGVSNINLSEEEGKALSKALKE